MHNEKIADELLAETRNLQDAYEYAIRRVKDIEHSRTMKTNPFGNQTVKQEPIHYINTRGRSNYANNEGSRRSRGGFRSRPHLRGQQNTNGHQQQQRNTNSNNQKQCYKCGNQLGQNHLQSCPAKDKNWSKYAKPGHFAKVCRPGSVNNMGDRNDEEQQEEIGPESQETDEPVAFAEFLSNNGWDEYQNDKLSVMAISEAFEIKNTAHVSEDDLNGHIVNLNTKTEELFAIADSGSPMSFLREKTARQS